MSEKIIQERLRKLAEYLDLEYEDDAKTCREAADLIDRLTTAPSEEAIRRDEREKCARVCDDFGKGLGGHWQTTAEGCAAAIRARNEEK